MIVFDTPGEIDLRAFTLMGVSAKPGTANPIGYFGTGLKYAIATLVRLGAQPVVYIGTDRYTFFKRPDTFRGQGFDKLSMRRESFRLTRPRVTDLPYAVSYGRNWEAWMAFRELESNTRDEGGTTYAVAAGVNGEVGRTRIVVDLPAFEEAYEDRDDVFLPEAQRGGSGVQVVARESEYLYWRGMRVFKLDKPALHTYNFLDQVALTEDRTLGNVYLARNMLAGWLLNCDDEDLIHSILKADEDHWEHELEYPSYMPPGDAFRRVMRRYPSGLSRSSWGYYGKYDDRVTDRSFRLEDAHPFPWRVSGGTVYDAKDRAVFDAPYGYEGKWDVVAGKIVNLLNPVHEVPGVEHEEEPADEIL